jgi:hypothetical protein
MTPLFQPNQPQPRNPHLYHPDQGAKVQPTGQHTKTPHTATGLFALLDGLLGAKGSGAPPAPRPRRRAVSLAAFCVTLGVLAGGLLFSAAPALASYGLSSSFGGEGSGNGKFKEPEAVAISEIGATKGDVYVVDKGNNRVEYFSSTGAYIGQFNGTEIDGVPAGAGKEAPAKFSEPEAIAIDNSGKTKAEDPSVGDVYVVDKSQGVIDKFSSVGEYLFQLTGISSAFVGIAVDTSGDVSVAEASETGRKFNNAAKNAAVGPLGLPFEAYASGGLAVDSQGNFYFGFQGGYVVTVREGRVFNLSAAVTGLAIDPATNNLFVDLTSGIAEYKPFPGEEEPPIEEFGGLLSGGSGIAVSATGTVYVADSAGNRVDIFMPGVAEAPAVVSESAAVKSTEATLEAQVNPDHQSTTYKFEYSKSATGETLNAPVTVLAGPGPLENFGSQTASVPTGAVLEPGTTYFYRVIAENTAHEKSEGKVQSFTTVPAPVTEVPSPIGTTTATFKGKLTPLSSTVATEYFFYYNLNAEPVCLPEHETLPHESAGTGTGTKAVTTAVTGLEPNHEYTVCLASVNAFGMEVDLKTPPIHFKTEPAPPEVIAGSEHATGVGSTRATLEAQVNPNNEKTTYLFEYATSAAEIGTASATKVPGTAELENFGGQPAVVETAKVLAPSTTYYYRVVAENEQSMKEPKPADGAVQSFTTLPAALVESESVSHVAATSATLEAQINPLGTSTTCQVQYVTAESFQSTGYAAASSAPCPAGLGAGEADVLTSVHVQDLAPDTVYHYRVVATNAFGTIEGELGAKGEEVDHTFTTQLASSVFALPDGRQWEMVSPPAKFGAYIWSTANPNTEYNFLAQASAVGNALVYLASSPTEAGAQGYSTLMQVLSTRGAAGASWVSRDLATQHNVPPGASNNDGYDYEFFSEDMSLAIMDPNGPFNPSLSAEASEQSPYVAKDYLSGGVDEPCLPRTMQCFRPMVTGKAGYANVPADTIFGGFLGGAGFHECGAVNSFRCGPRVEGVTPDLSHVVLGAEAALTPGAGEYNHYEWSDGQLQPLYVLPKSEGGGVVNAGEFGGAGEPGGPAPSEHLLSNDGSVFFPYGGHLYLHDVAKHESLRLDVAQGVAEPGKAGAVFIYASSDGSRVFFSDPQQLTSAAGGGVYECRIVEGPGGLSCELELTGLAGGTFAGGSEDASYVYFVGAEEKLYVDHYNGLKWTTRLIADLAGTEGNDWSIKLAGARGRTSRVSPNGQWLAFMSQLPLTGYDTHDAVSGRPDQEVYLYDAAADGGEGRLVCASCNPTGARPVGVEGQAADVPVWKGYYGYSESFYQSRYLLDSGRLFFDSSDALVPQDVNGAVDVYEYEPPTVGDCTASGATYGERSGGCVDLISSGTSPVESRFMDASENGGDVFFRTNARLAPQDFDTSPDVYDAHECTSSSPCAPTLPAAAPECTTADACRAAPAPQPSLFGAPSSATFSGAGNITSTPPPTAKKVAKKTVKCKRGFTKKHNKCIKNKKKAKKSTHRKGSK